MAEEEHFRKFKEHLTKELKEHLKGFKEHSREYRELMSIALRANMAVTSIGVRGWAEWMEKVADFPSRLAKHAGPGSGEQGKKEMHAGIVSEYREFLEEASQIPLRAANDITLAVQRIVREESKSKSKKRQGAEEKGKDEKAEESSRGSSPERRVRIID